jgi:hypothetical protein
LNDVEIPRGIKKYLVLGTAEGVQHWQDGELVKEIIKKPGVDLLDVKAENVAIPQSEWDESDFGPRPPWSHQYAVYLFDPHIANVITYMNNTNGAEIAWRKLRSAIKWKSLLSGRMVTPTVTLGQRLVSKTYKKLGPCFDIVADGWRDLGLQPASAPTEPAALEAPKDAMPGVAVKDPPLKEIMQDEVPWSDPIDDILNAPTKPEITKRAGR